MKPLFSVPFIILFCLSMTALAQEDHPTPDVPPSAVTAPVGKYVPPPAPKKETAEKWEQEPLRDPFWPIDFFPPNWQRKVEDQGALNSGNADGWTEASAKLRVGGTSRLGDRAAAIINGELKSVGEKVEVLHEGKTYQWEIIGIGVTGQIQLKKTGIR